MCTRNHLVNHESHKNLRDNGETKWVPIEEKWPNPLILLAGTTRLELATFPHSHAGRSNQGFDEMCTFSTFDFFFTLHSRRPLRVFLMINQLLGSF